MAAYYTYFIQLNTGLLIKLVSRNMLYVFLVAQPAPWFASYLGTHTY